MRTLLCAIARMENAYIREWVEYYKNLGFTNICLYDNNYDEEEHFEDVIFDYIDSGFVILKNYRNRSNCQIDAYTECYREYENQYDWIAFFDCDEFLELKAHENIIQYLTEERFKCFTSIRINWMLYGDNDMLINDGRPVLERFKLPLPINSHTHCDDIENELYKVFIRGYLNISKYGGPDGFEFLSPHTSNIYPVCDNVGHDLDKYKLHPSLPPNHEWALLKHYSTKTATEYCHKIRRGFPDENNKLTKDYLIENVFFKVNKPTPAKVKIFKDELGVDMSYLLK